MNRGFIPLLAALIIGVISLVTAGGVYTVVKINNLEKENKKITEELVEQKETAVQETVSDEESTTTEIAAAEIHKQEIKSVDVVKEKTPAIIQQTKPSVTIPLEPNVLAPTLDNTVNEETVKKVAEEKAIDLFLMNLLKAAGEITLASSKLSEALRVTGENPTIAKLYATESLDLEGTPKLRHLF